VSAFVIESSLIAKDHLVLTLRKAASAPVLMIGRKTLVAMKLLGMAASRRF
jgi:hypothetical protein